MSILSWKNWPPISTSIILNDISGLYCLLRLNLLIHLPTNFFHTWHIPYMTHSLPKKWEWSYVTAWCEVLTPTFTFLVGNLPSSILRTLWGGTSQKNHPVPILVLSNTAFINQTEEKINLFLFVRLFSNFFSGDLRHKSWPCWTLGSIVFSCYF